LTDRISFDRAADYYDRTRELPAQTRDSVADLLAGELAGRAACLEIGVGTGRMALPLHRRGVPLIGADIAEAMLTRLVDNAGGQSPFPLLLADAGRLPLADGSVDAVFAAHVLHLLPHWQDAVDEVVRVLRPGGVFLVDFGGGTPAPWSPGAHEVLARHGVAKVRPGVSDADKVSRHLGDRVTMRRLAPITLSVPRTFGEDITGWERQIYSWTWSYPAETMTEAVADVRAWAADNDWPLDREIAIDRTIQWWAFDLS
jgi:ubiquinone/menaquinone biosynthesis C-methylase UbiE